MPTLADAIIAEDISSVHQYLQTGIDVNEIDEYGFTYLIEAAIADNIAITELLIQYGADVNLQDPTGFTALHWAAENNNLKLAKILLEHRANPNAYTFAGQPVLVMPLLRNQSQIKKLLQQYGADLSFAQDFINTKTLGHMFELVGTANIIDPHNNFVEMDFEGFFLEVTIAMIADSLNHFKNHYGARKVRQYSQYAQVIIEVLTRAAHLMKYLHYRIDTEKYKNEINKLVQQEPLLIPIGYEGHAITFIKLGNILAKCDRREDSRLYDNIYFYKIGYPERFNADFIRFFIAEKHSSEFINDQFPEIVGLEPITELKIEAQISGNCSWANVEAAIPTIFFMLLMTNDDTTDISQKKNLSLNFFHQWREWNKNRALQFCIQSFKSGDSLRNACRAEVLAAILFQRCRMNNYNDQEKIDSILKVLIQPAYRHVLENYIKSYVFEGFSEEGKEFARLLRHYDVMK